MKFSGTTEIQAPRDRVWAFVIDPQQVGWCGPGVESIEAIDDTHFRARAKVGIGVISSRFNVNLELAELVGRGLHDSGWKRGRLGREGAGRGLHGVGLLAVGSGHHERQECDGDLPRLVVFAPPDPGDAAGMSFGALAVFIRSHFNLLRPRPRQCVLHMASIR